MAIGWDCELEFDGKGFNTYSHYRHLSMCEPRSHISRSNTKDPHATSLLAHIRKNLKNRGGKCHLFSYPHEPQHRPTPSKTRGEPHQFPKPSNNSAISSSKTSAGAVDDCENHDIRELFTFRAIQFVHRRKVGSAGGGGNYTGRGRANRTVGDLASRATFEMWRNSLCQPSSTIAFFP